LGSSVIAVLASAYAFWVIAGAGYEIVYYGCLLLFSSIPVYVWMKWRAIQSVKEIA
jgi:APA family basic amino acid/polyamine antiporter